MANWGVNTDDAIKETNPSFTGMVQSPSSITTLAIPRTLEVVGKTRHPLGRLE